MKQKAFFIIFKGFLLNQITFNIFLDGENPILITLLICFDYGFNVNQLQFWIKEIQNYDMSVTYKMIRRT